MHSIFMIFFIFKNQREKVYNNINDGKQLFIVSYNFQRNIKYIKLARERKEGES